MLQFDPITREIWKEKNIASVSLDFVSAGCDGTEIRLHEGMIKEGYTPTPIKDTNVLCYIDSQYINILEGAYIAGVKGKWILKSEDILTRCGCSKSFSLKSDNQLADKIRLLKSKLSKKPKHSL